MKTTEQKRREIKKQLTRDNTRMIFASKRVSSDICSGLM